MMDANVEMIIARHLAEEALGAIQAQQRLSQDKTALAQPGPLSAFKSARERAKPSAAALGALFDTLSPALNFLEIIALRELAISELDPELYAATARAARAMDLSPSKLALDGKNPLCLLMSQHPEATVDPAHPQRGAFQALFSILVAEMSALEDGLNAPFLGKTTKNSGMDDWRPIHFASACGSVELIQELLAAGAQVDGVNAKGTPSRAGSPLNTAIKARAAASVEALIKAGADIHLQVIATKQSPDPKTPPQQTVESWDPLSCAVDERWAFGAEALLRAGACFRDGAYPGAQPHGDEKMIDLASGNYLFWPIARCSSVLELSRDAVNARLARQDARFKAQLAERKIEARAIADALNGAGNPLREPKIARPGLFSRFSKTMAVALGHPDRQPAPPPSAPAASPPGPRQDPLPPQRPDELMERDPWDKISVAVQSGFPDLLEQAFENARSLSPLHASESSLSDLPWLAALLACSVSRPQEQEGRLACLRKLAQAADALPELRGEFFKRHPRFGGLSIAGFALLLNNRDAFEALGPLAEQILNAATPEEGSHDLSAAAAGSSPELLAAALEATAGPTLSYLCPIAPDNETICPLGVALWHGKHDNARVICERMGAIIPRWRVISLLQREAGRQRYPDETAYRMEPAIALLEKLLSGEPGMEPDWTASAKPALKPESSQASLSLKRETPDSLKPPRSRSIGARVKARRPTGQTGA